MDTMKSSIQNVQYYECVAMKPNKICFESINHNSSVSHALIRTNWMNTKEIV